MSMNVEDSVSRITVHQQILILEYSTNAGRRKILPEWVVLALLHFDYSVFVIEK